VNIDTTKLLAGAKKIPPYVILGGMGFATLWVIRDQQNVVIALPLVGILAVIVSSLAIYSLRRH
jgi:hypothetical protein